jgi:hypothetical protein
MLIVDIANLRPEQRVMLDRVAFPPGVKPHKVNMFQRSHLPHPLLWLFLLSS